MHTADDSPGTELQTMLDFKHLPEYALFLLHHRLEAFSAALLRISRELEIPLLRFFEALPESELIRLGKEGNTVLLGHLSRNDAATYLADSLRSWTENQLPLIQGNDVVIEDITKVNFSRRKAFRDFLPQYTDDPVVFISIMEEVDRFTLAQDELSFKTLFELKEKKIREHHHFIDKINNTSPGIIYVVDLLTQKQIYSNHKREEMLGYTDAEMNAMDGDAMSGLIHPDDLEELRRHITAFADAAEGEIRTVEYRIRNKAGHYSWQRGYETVFKRTEAGQPSEIIGIAIDVTAEKEYSMQLEQREQQLREAQEIAGMGSFEWDLTGSNRSVFSPQLLRIFEMEAGSSLESFLEFVHPSDRRKVREALGAAISGGTMYECEYRYQKNGPEKVIWSRGVVKFIKGKATSLRGTIMDVSLRHDMLKRLERSDELHKQAQALTHLGNWSWRLSDNRIEWSDEMYRIYGLQPQAETITPERFMSFIHSDDRAKRQAEIERALSTAIAEDYTIRIVAGDGMLKVLQGKGEVMVDEHGKPYKLIGTCQDITRQALLHDQLKESEEASRQLINSAPEAIIVIDEESHIVLWNPKAEEIFGWQAQDIIGKTLMETIIPKAYRHAHNSGVKRFIDTGIPRVLNTTIEISALKKNGAEFYISLSVSRSLQGGREAFIAFIRDISNEKANELKLAEQRNQLGQKNAELERTNQELMAFNYIASHDLQEPVRKIRMFTSRITERESEALTSGAKDALQRIDASASHMQKLIEGLVAFSRTTMSGQHPEPVDMNDMVAELTVILKDQIEEKGATVIYAALPVVNVLRFQFRQLLENIIGNALKYCRPGVPPVIHIAAATVPGTDIPDALADPQMQYWRISIADSGIGFEPQYAGKVFELFQRLHNKDAYSGTGIGLAICKKIVQNHHGFIMAQGKPDEGAVFSIYIPLAAGKV